MPSVWRSSAPAPTAQTSGVTPRMKAIEVIRIGRSRRCAASTAAAKRSRPASSSCLANSTIRMAFLAARPISTMKPTCVRILLSCPRMHDADDGGDQAHRHDHDHRQRQRQALELRRQHQEHEHHRQHEGEHRGIAGAQLLEGERGPLIGEAFRQRLRRQLLHDLDRLALAVAGRGRAIEFGRRIEIIARHAVGPGDGPHRGEGAERHGIRPLLLRTRIRKTSLGVACGSRFAPARPRGRCGRTD